MQSSTVNDSKSGRLFSFTIWKMITIIYPHWRHEFIRRLLLVGRLPWSFHYILVEQIIKDATFVFNPSCSDMARTCCHIFSLKKPFSDVFYILRNKLFRDWNTNFLFCINLFFHEKTSFIWQHLTIWLALSRTVA